MIKMSLVEVKNAETALNKVLSSQLDIKTSYNLGKIVKKLNEELTNLESIRIKLVDKYGTVNEKGEKNVEKDNLKEFYREYGEALKIEVEFDINKISIDKLSDIKLTPIEVSSLISIIEEPKES